MVEAVRQRGAGAVEPLIGAMTAKARWVWWPLTLPSTACGTASTFCELAPAGDESCTPVAMMYALRTLLLRHDHPGVTPIGVAPHDQGQRRPGLSDPPKAEGRLLEAADWALSTAALLLAEQIGHDTALAASGGERSRRT